MAMGIERFASFKLNLSRLIGRWPQQMPAEQFSRRQIIKLLSKIVLSV